jgi:hypothetical protein
VCDVAPQTSLLTDTRLAFLSFVFFSGYFGENKRFIMFISSRDVMYFFFIMKRHTSQSEHGERAMRRSGCAEHESRAGEDERAETEKVLSLIENW